MQGAAPASWRSSVHDNPGALGLRLWLAGLPADVLRAQRARASCRAVVPCGHGHLPV